jgi:hypothetical protein
MKEEYEQSLAKQEESKAIALRQFQNLLEIKEKELDEYRMKPSVRLFYLILCGIYLN